MSAYRRTAQINYQITKSRNYPISHHLRAPQIMQVNDAFQPTAVAHYRQGRDLLLLHEVERRGGELVRPDCFRVASHALGGGEIEYVLAAAFQQPAQVAVADDAHQLIAIGDGGDAQPLARH